MPRPRLDPSAPCAGSVAGKLAAGNTSWVPATYVASQQAAVKRFFQQNGYIGYDTVRWLRAPCSPSIATEHRCWDC